MSTVPRILVWVGAIALVIFVVVTHQSVGTLKTRVQGHTAALDKPVLAAEVFPGVPTVFAERWSTATQGTGLTSQDHLWLTLYLANTGQSQVRGITANLMLLPVISAIYPDSGTLVGHPQQVLALLQEHSGGQPAAPHNHVAHVVPCEVVRSPMVFLAQGHGEGR